MIKFSEFLSEATKLWWGFRDLPRTMDPELRKFFTTLEKFTNGDDSDIYIDDAYNYSRPSKQLTIKITDLKLINNIVAAKEFASYAFQKSGAKYVSSMGVNVVLYPSGGIRGTGKLPKKGEAVSNPSTTEQEMGTIYYFEQAFKGKTPTKQEVSDAVGFAFDDDWMHNFKEQADAFIKGIGKLPRHNIYLDSGKNDSNIIVNLAKKFGLKDSKDNWNPADIWIMNISGSKILSETANIKSLAEYNAWLVDKFESQEIIGVSLKKINKKNKGKFQVVTTKTLPKVELEPMRVLFDPFQKNFIFETQGSISGFNIRTGYKASTITKESQINVYLEGRQKGSDVQLGAVSAQLFKELALDNGFDIAADKKRILANPMKYLNDTLPKILRHPAVENKASPFPSDELQLKAGAILTYYLEILLYSNNDILKDSYYSSSKMNAYSSIHVKVS